MFSCELPLQKRVVSSSTDTVLSPDSMAFVRWGGVGWGGMGWGGMIGYDDGMG